MAESRTRAPSRSPDAPGRGDARGPLPGMARWRWLLYRLLARFEVSEAEYFDLPADRRVQVDPLHDA